MEAFGRQVVRQAPFSVRWASPLLAAAAALVIAACGGGGDGSEEQARSTRMAVDSTPLTEIPMYTVTTLSLGGGGGWVERKGVNASGQVAGYLATPQGSNHAFFYDGTTITDLGALGGTASKAIALNDSGSVVGQACLSGDFYCPAFFWKPGGAMQQIGTAVTTIVAGINNAGLVAGYEGGGQFGFAWTEAQGLQTLVGSTYFSPRDVNGNGQMSGYVTGAAHAVRNADGTVSLTGVASYGVPSLINDDGIVAGWFYKDFNLGNARVYTWRAGALDVVGERLAVREDDRIYPVDLNQGGELVGTTSSFPGVVGQTTFRTFVSSPTELVSDIGSLPDAPFTNPYAINNHGQVVGYSGGGVINRAFTWTRATGIVDLNSRLSNPPANLILSAALAISDNGSIVAVDEIHGSLVLLKPVVSDPPAAPAALGPITANDPVATGRPVNASVSFTDVNTTDTHTAAWDWGDGTPVAAGSVTEANGSGSASGSHTYAAAGLYTARVTVTDSTGKSTVVSTNIVVYDPAAGYVTGKGTINSPIGAYRAVPTLGGPASFSFTSKYNRGATTPSGKTAFDFKAAQLTFRAELYDWLVVSGARAQYKGVGLLNGQPGYKFLLTAVDGASLGRTTPDRFRIKIWHVDAALQADVVDYDNQLSTTAEGTNDEGTQLASGSVVIKR